ncbi:bifunctional sugar-1-phosphate nucleotidylyltransferase/acetyltransferase [Methanoregula sp.]|uniref:bifunctional sugar-1-phosphate nucleotidylyltransferase/acetyltransferase n=1 Tax=Methanoregula sp. TaxID=2052170 RepID=UPI002C9809F7|nr:bifunctional sugar-1-phosphate nucleotidylyltransferase/acetyltransferase [Methanoregula sp.]HVP96565.1 bifunctional sugar-1-phosphate nucleotidylyltransferase/acetyltransferase [Methanoregula sp.]
MQAVILAAGEGRRVRPLTWSRPKAMIPVANRPIIAYTIDALVANGIRDIIVVVGYRREQVTRFLNQLDLPIEVVVQEKQLGTAHALQQAESRISENFLLLPGDNYIDTQSIAKIRESTNAVLVKDHPSPSNFGVITLRDGCLESIVEKPEHAQSFLVSTGIYSLRKDFFRYIRGNDITEAIAGMIDEGLPINAITADDWQDAIYPWDLLRLNQRLLKHIPAAREGTVSRHATIHGPVKIGSGTIVGPNTVISGPVVIGDNCTIGPNCCILPNTSIGSRVMVESLSVIGNAIIMDDTMVGSHSRIVDSVISERCRLADHTSAGTASGIIEIEDIPIHSQFGAILGDNVTCGPFNRLGNSIIGNNATLEGSRDVRSRVIPDGAVVI